MTRPERTLLCVANFRSNAGFAWTFIETLYARVAVRLADRGIRTLVAYPRIDEAPRALQGSPALGVEFPVVLDRLEGCLSLLRFVRQEQIEALYLSDRPSWHPVYSLLRVAGVQRIVVHDHTSGERTPPRGVKRLLKGISRRLPGTVPDRVLAVSDFVRQRKVEVDLIPPERVHTVWNSVELPSLPLEDTAAVRRRVGAPPGRPLVACASRAAPEKGIDLLLQAFDLVLRVDTGPRGRPFLVYMGDGPVLEELRSLRASLDHPDDVLLTGYRSDAWEVLGAADLCVVPSRWAEAFGLAALEPMSWGVPVVASDVGGLPEVVVDRVTGRLFPPDDAEALARVMLELLRSPEERRRMGRRARERVEEHFTLAREVDELMAHLTAGWPKPHPGSLTGVGGSP